MNKNFIFGTLGPEGDWKYDIDYIMALCDLE